MAKQQQEAEAQGYRNPKLGARSQEKTAFLRLRDNLETFTGIYLEWAKYTPEKPKPGEPVNPFDQEAEIYWFDVLGLDGIWRRKGWQSRGIYHANDAQSRAGWPKLSVSDFMACIPTPEELAKMKMPGGVVIRVTRFGKAKDTSTTYAVEILGVPKGFKPVLTLVDAGGKTRFSDKIPVDDDNLDREKMNAVYLEANPGAADEPPPSENE